MGPKPLKIGETPDLSNFTCFLETYKKNRRNNFTNLFNSTIFAFTALYTMHDDYKILLSQKIRAKEFRIQLLLLTTVVQHAIAKSFTLNNLTAQLKNNDSNNKYPI